MRQQKDQKIAIAGEETPLQRLEVIAKKCKCGAYHSPKPTLPKGIRRLKVQPKYVERAGNNSYVPLIMLKGEWLRKTGFDCEDHVIITEEPGRLVIRLEK